MRARPSRGSAQEHFAAQPRVAAAPIGETAVERTRFSALLRRALSGGQLRRAVSLALGFSLVAGLGASPKIETETDAYPRLKKLGTMNVPFVGVRLPPLNPTVDLDVTVAADGKVESVRVRSSNNPWFERTAIDAAYHTTYLPAKKDGRPVPADVELSQTLMSVEQWAFSKGKAHAELPEYLRWDVPPELTWCTLATYPFEELLQAKQGKVSVRFVIDDRGKLAEFIVQQATTPAMGLAIQAMIEAWEFEPARRRDGTPVGAALALEFEFLGRGGDVPITDGGREVLRLLRKSPKKICTPAELDQKIRPVSRRAPVRPFPQRQSLEAGEALIEFFIDPQGDAQLPRVISASRPEYGFAAAQAVAVWRFEPPRRGGKPATVRVRVPVKFAVPTEPPAVRR